MTPREWEQYQAETVPEAIIRGDEFPLPSLTFGMRLLCRGYHANGGPNVRIWLRYDGQIGVQHYDGDIEFREWWFACDLYPSKRAYREDTDLLFARLIRDRHIYPLSFTTWQN